MTQPADAVFSERAERALDVAAEVARHFEVPYVGAQHLLIALALNWDSLAARTLLSFSLDDKVLYDDLKRVEESVVHSLSYSGQSPNLQLAIKLGVAEAQRLGSPNVDTEHLLLGVAASGGVATGILEYHHLDVDMLRAELERLLDARK